MAGIFTGNDVPTTAAAEQRPSVLPNEILGSTELDTNVNAQGVGGPGLWKAPTATGIKTFNQLAREAWQLSPGELEDLQQRLYASGYYDDSTYSKHANPDWGRFDEATQNAYLSALLDANRYPDKTIDQHMTERAGSQRARLASLQSDGAIKDLQPRFLSSDVVQLSNINVDDPASLRKVANSVTRSLLGKDASDSFREAFASEIRDQQVAQGQAQQAQQRATAEARAGVERSSAQRAADYDREKALGPDATADELGAFKNVIANDVVGPISAFASGPAYSPMAAKLTQYGIDTETLASWASEARADGIAVPALSTPQAVEVVVDNHVKRLFKQSGGDWTSVAHQFAYDIDASMKKSRGGTAFSAAGTGVTAHRPGMGPPAPRHVYGSANLGSGSLFGTGPGTPAGQAGHDLDARNAANQLTADLAGQGPTSTPAGASDLGPLANQIVAGMGRRLGRLPGTQAATAGGVIGDNTPIFTGGQTVEQIDPQARAEEEIRRQRPDEVYEYGLMNQMQAFEALMGGGR